MPDKPHVDRFADLPEHTKVFFESLTAEDIASLKEGIALAKATKTMGRIWKWIFILAVAAFGGMATIGQSIEWLMTRLKN